MNILTFFSRVVPVSFTLSACLISATHAGIVVNGTRVILENGQTEKSVQMTNKDHFPNLVQVWSDRGNEHLNIETADGPFLANPNIFKLNAGQSQVLRLNLIANPNSFSLDRESMFFLNVNEIPALKAKDVEANRLTVSFTNRLKVLYRPKGMIGQVNDVPNQVNYSVKNQAIQLNNPTNFYAHISTITAFSNGQQLDTKKSLVIPPQNHIQWKSNKLPAQNAPLELKATFINDYGAGITTTLNAQ